jgi:hypothetical protein
VSTDPNPESTIREIFTDYQKALTTRDPAFPEKWFITDEEYKQLLDYVAKKQPNCIGSDESGFRSETNKKAYNDLLSSELVINKIVVNKIEYNSSCGDLLQIPRVLCTVQYSGKKVVEIPFLLVKTMNHGYKILRNFMNYKLFKYE